MEETCANCGAPRSGAFCSVCGQNDRVYLGSALRLVREAVAAQLDLDSRLVRTARALLTRPGFLTNEFVRDKRARYLPPVRLYLFVSVVFFFVSSLTGTFTLDLEAMTDDETTRVEDGRADEDFLEVYADLLPEERARVRSLIAKNRFANAATRARMDAIDSNAAPAREATPLERRVRDRLILLFENPQSVSENVANRLPVALFLTVPLYAAFLKLLYRRRYYVEHLVFALHLHAFLFVVGTPMVLMPENAAGAIVVRMLQLAGGVYYFLALRNVYPEPWPRVAGKFVAINALHAALLVTAIVLTTFLMLLF